MPNVNEPVIPTLPVNSCLSFCASPNLFEPLAYIIDDDMYITFNSVAFIVPATVKSVLTTKPLFGEITAVAEPDFSVFKSPIAPALILNKPPPSPLNKDADIDDEILSEADN